MEAVAPVRSFASCRGQRNGPGMWWSATSGAHLGYESWPGREHAVLPDFDARVGDAVAIFGGE